MYQKYVKLCLSFLLISVVCSKNNFIPTDGQVYLFTNLGKYSPVLDVVKNIFYESKTAIIEIQKGLKICEKIKNEVIDINGLVVVVSDSGLNDFCNIDQRISNIQLLVNGDNYQLYHRSNDGYPVTSSKIRGDANTVVNLFKSAFFDIFVDNYLHNGNVYLSDINVPKRGFFNFKMSALGWIIIGAIIASGILDKWDFESSTTSPTDTIQELQLLKPQEYRIKPKNIILKNNPIKNEDFRKIMNLMTEYVIDYFEHPEVYEVTTSVKAGDVFKNIPENPPHNPETFKDILKDVYKIIMPGLTHWQHPRFHAYFAAGRSIPDLLAEIVASTISVVNFSWDASPSVAELEVAMVNWVGKIFNIPEKFLFKSVFANDSEGGGALQDSASDAILIAMLSARYRHLTKESPINMEDRNNEHKVLTKLVAYASSEAHSCIEKAAMICLVHLRPIKVNINCSIRGDELEKNIIRDIERGLKPFFVHLTLGTTATCAFDNLKEIIPIAKKYDIWIHVDAAYAGSAWVCPEYRFFTEGLEEVDSLDINLHKMFLLSTSGAFLYSKHAKLIKETMTMTPAYLRQLKDRDKEITDFRNWSLALSRRPRALKVWFLLRLYGVKGMQEYIRHLVQLTTRFKSHLENDPRIELFGEQVLTLVCFRLKLPEKESNELTKKLATYINNSRKLLVTPAKPRGFDIIRISISHQFSSEIDIDQNYQILSDIIDEFLILSNKKNLASKTPFVADRGIVGSPVASTANTVYSNKSNTKADSPTSKNPAPKNVLSPVVRSETKLNLHSDASPLRRDFDELKMYPELKSEKTPPKDLNNTTANSSSEKNNNRKDEESKEK